MRSTLSYLGIVPDVLRVGTPLSLAMDHAAGQYPWDAPKHGRYSPSHILGQRSPILNPNPAES
jgi:hypothetical protein